MSDERDFRARTINWSYRLWYSDGPNEAEARTEFARTIRAECGVEVPLDQIPIEVDFREILLQPAQTIQVRRSGWLGRLLLGELESVRTPPEYRREYSYMSTGAYTWIEPPRRIDATWSGGENQN